MYMFDAYPDASIFVQIASFRDSQLVPTLMDLFDKADNPHDIRVCVCWQHSEEDDWDTLEHYVDDPRVDIIDVKAEDSKGVCWARNLIQQRYKGEDFTLQLDSHHRFVESWDTKLKNQIMQLQCQGHEKPLITGYMPAFHPSWDKEKWTDEPWQMDFDRFTPDGVIFFKPGGITNWENLKTPVPGRFYSAHFCFTLGKFCKEVQHDPRYYFHGEEITIGVRAFTYGYDIFHSHEMIAWHEFSRDYRPDKHWDTYSNHTKHNQRTYELMRGLLGIDGEVMEDKYKFGQFGLGDVRTVKEWEEYAGVRFEDRAVKQSTINGDLPKVSDEPFARVFKHCIDIHKNDIKDVDFVAVIIKDVDGNELHRRDYTMEEIEATTHGDWINLWVDAVVDSKPTSWIVWPNDGEWLELISEEL